MKYRFSRCCLHLFRLLVLLWLAPSVNALTEPVSLDQSPSFDCSIATEFPLITRNKCQDYVVNRQSVSSEPEKIKVTACPVETVDPEDKEYLEYFIHTNSPDWLAWLCRDKKEREGSQQPETPTFTLTVVDKQLGDSDSGIPNVSGGGYDNDFFDDRRPGKPGMPGRDVAPFLLETVSASRLPAGVISFAFDLELPESPGTSTIFQQGVMSDGSDVLVVISGTRQRMYRRVYQLGNWYLAGQVDSAALPPDEEQLDDFIAEDKLVRALAGVFGWAGKDSVPVYQLPLGKTAGSERGLPGGQSDSTRGSGTSNSGYSSSKGQSQGQGQGSSRKSGDQPSQPPQNNFEFMNSIYCQQITDPRLFALGFGFNPFILGTHSHGGLSALDVFDAAERRGLLHRFFHAFEYHNAVIEGRTDYMNWMYEPDEVNLPSEPTLYYLAQVQPVDWVAMATVLDLHCVIGQIKSDYPSDARLQQLAMFNRALGMMGITWESLAIAYSASEATGHVVPESSNRIIKVESSDEDETGLIDQAIHGQMRLLPPQDSVLLREAVGISVAPETSHVFAAALGLNPNTIYSRNADNSLSVYSIFGAAEQRIIGFNWNHIAVAAHVTGHLGVLGEQHHLDDYLTRYGDIPVDPITGNTNYLEVRQMVSRLLSKIAQRNMEWQKLSRDTSQSATPSDSLSTFPTDSSTGSNTCCICLEKEANILFTPCNHLTCCAFCSRKVDICPKCRGRVKERIKIYKN